MQLYNQYLIKNLQQNTNLDILQPQVAYGHAYINPIFQNPIYRPQLNINNINTQNND